MHSHVIKICVSKCDVSKGSKTLTYQVIIINAICTVVLRVTTHVYILLLFTYFASASENRQTYKMYKTHE